MNFQGFYCLMLSGKKLTDQIREALLVNAYDMFENERKSQQIKSPAYDGMITTNFEIINYVGMSGLVFNAEVSGSKVGATKVRFFVRTSDLEDGFLEQLEWIDLNPKKAQRKYKRHELN